MSRVILDTNLWISYLISKRLGKIDVLFERDDLVLLFSEELLEEFIEVARRLSRNSKGQKYSPIPHSKQH